MSKTTFNGRFSATVNDPGDLPDGVDQDTVWVSLRAAVARAATEWHAVHPGLLAHEPEVE